MNRPAAIARGSIELLGSMRFAISLLTVIAIVSTVGTLLQQNAPSINYVNQFGPFWAEIFSQLGLYRLYNATGFLLALSFLVVSTSVCLWRNTPKIIADARSFQDRVRRSTLSAFTYHRVINCAPGSALSVDQVHLVLHRLGYRSRMRVPATDAQAQLIVGKQGSGSRYGYIFTHAAIVVICIGGLLDSDLLVRAQIWFNGKQTISPQSLGAAIPDSARLPVANPVYRANLFVPEGATVGQSLVAMGDRVLVQPLPFQVHLKRFIVEYYSTGSPRRFASDIEIIDPINKRRFPVTIDVNRPFTYQGVTLYQSSFDDGGSLMRLRAYPLTGASAQSEIIEGKVGTILNKALGLTGIAPYSIELTGLRLFNIENIGNTNAGDTKPPQINEKLSSVNMLSRLASPAANTERQKHFKNIGPSLQYKLRDTSGQALEFDSYLQPVIIDGQAMFLNGIRAKPDQPFQYLRLPADSQGRPDTFLALRAALQDPERRQAAVARFMQINQSKDPVLNEQLRASVQRALETFAVGGLQGIANYLDRNVKSNEQNQAADVLAKLITAAIYALWETQPVSPTLSAPTSQLSNNVSASTAATTADTTSSVADAFSSDSRFVQNTVAALSDLTLFGSPALLMGESFVPIQASVLQAARAPGSYLVYLGCALLLTGVFAMFYIRERRVWLWWDPRAGEGGQWTVALSSSRQTLAVAQDFEALMQHLYKAAAPSSTVTDRA